MAGTLQHFPQKQCKWQLTPVNYVSKYKMASDLKWQFVTKQLAAVNISHAHHYLTESIPP